MNLGSEHTRCRATAEARRSAFRLAAAAHLSAVVAIAVCAYAGVLPTTLPRFPHADLAGHALLIGLLALLVDGALGWRALIRTLPWLHAGPALVLAVAAVEEWAQRFSPRRTSSWADFAADVAGVCLFAWLGRRLRRTPARSRLG